MQDDRHRRWALRMMRGFLGATFLYFISLALGVYMFRQPVSWLSILIYVVGSISAALLLVIFRRY